MNLSDRTFSGNGCQAEETETRTAVECPPDRRRVMYQGLDLSQRSLVFFTQPTKLPSVSRLQIETDGVSHSLNATFDDSVDS